MLKQLFYQIKFAVFYLVLDNSLYLGKYIIGAILLQGGIKHTPTHI